MFSFLTDLFKPKAAVAPPITSETSMGFELEDIGPFFTVLANNPRFGLPSNLSDFMKSAMGDVSPDASKRWKIEGDFDGSPVEIDIEVAMDDVDVPEISFFSTKAVIDEIDKELIAFGDATGK